MKFKLLPGAKEALPISELEIDYASREMLVGATDEIGDPAASGGSGGANNASLGIGELAVYATSTDQLCSYVSRAELIGATYSVSSKSCHSCAYSNEVPVAVIALADGGVVRIIFDDLETLQRFTAILGIAAG